MRSILEENRAPREAAADTLQQDVVATLDAAVAHGHVERERDRERGEDDAERKERLLALVDGFSSRRVLVLGDPVYYARFGFVLAARFGLKCPVPASDNSFMAIELEPGAFAKASGTVRYGHESDDLE